MNTLTKKELELVDYVAQMFGQAAADSQRDLILMTKKSAKAVA